MVEKQKTTKIDDLRATERDKNVDDKMLLIIEN